MCRDKPLKMSLWDTGGKEQYSRIRALSYPKTNLFFFCFSVVNEASFANLKTKWYPEIKHHIPTAQILIVGTKCDLRSDPNYTSQVSFEEATNLAKEIGAVGYVECSSLNGERVNNVFDTAISLFEPERVEEEKTKKCVLF